jgi:hypothetical protein
MTKNKILMNSVGLFLMLVIAPISMAAGEIVLELDTGVSELSDGRYDDSLTARLTGGYTAGNFTVVASLYEFDDFDLNGSNSNVELDGYSAQAFYALGSESLKFDLGAGLLTWESDAFFEGLKVGSDSGTSPVVEARIRKPLGSLVSLLFSARHINDESGADINTLSAGIQFSF